MNKKGAIEGLQELIAPLIGIALVLVVGFLIFSEAKDKVVSITGVSTTYTNETVSTWTNNTYQSLTHSTNCMLFSCSEVLNNTGGAISTTCYNCTVGLGFAIMDGTATCSNTTTAVNVSYSCTNKTIAFNATGDIQNATQDIPGWLPIIVITVIGALLIGLVARFRRS